MKEIKWFIGVVLMLMTIGYVFGVYLPILIMWLSSNLSLQQSFLFMLFGLSLYGATAIWCVKDIFRMQPETEEL